MISDVLIIGAGPVGLFAIHQCGMLGLSVQVIDSLPEIGGQCSALYPEKPIYDIPAYPQIFAGDLIHQLEAQAKPFQPAYHLDQTVEKIEKIDNIWHVRTSKGQGVQARTLIIAAGAGAFGPNRPPLEKIKAYEGASIFYMVKHREDFRDKRIIIAGGGDSAVDWALSLSEIAKEVTLVHRRAKFRAALSSLKRLEDLARYGRVTIRTPYQIKALIGSPPELEGVRIATLNGEEEEIAADCLLPFFGLSNELGPIKEWGLEINQNYISVVPATCQTNIPGIYAIGDIADYPKKLKLILTGFAEAAQAAHAIRRYLFPDQDFHHEHSTTKGLPNMLE